MEHKRLAVALAVVCLLIGSAYAVAKLIPASVDESKCIGCGECVGECPAGAVSIGDDGTAVVDKEKCTGCGKCAKSCPVEAISTE
ncbi:MAG TPA: 4Fe-4S binding protein [Methanothrix sp.]|nr:4Fe-4S binding protein [Methanothrix sp.]